MSSSVIHSARGSGDVLVAALDFGGTKVALGLVDSAGVVLARAEVPTSGLDPQGVVGWTAVTLDRLCGTRGLKPETLRAIGATVPGLADETKRTLVFAPAHGWRDIPFAAMLETDVGLPARIENDVNACALAEQRFGLARGIRHLLWVTVSTGIGGALILHNELFEGAGAAGELGHLIVEKGGPLCGCGHRGCLEAVVGLSRCRGTGVVRGRRVEPAWAMIAGPV